jgi:PAS domain S-box-containing protein
VEPASASPPQRPELLDLLFEQAGVALCLVAPGGRVVRANGDWLRAGGFAWEDVAGADILDLFPEARDVAAAQHARVRAGETIQVPRHARRVNDRETWLEGRISPVPMAGGTGLLITERDVTAEVVARRLADAERDEAERALAAAAARLRASYELTAALGTAHAPAEVARIVMGRGLAAFGATAGTFAVPTRDGALEIIDAAGYPAPVIEAWRGLGPGVVSPIAEAFRTRAPVWIAAPAEAQARFPSWAAVVALGGEGADGAWAALPLVSDGELLGVLGLGFRRGAPFRADERALHLSVSQKCAQALDRTRLFAGEREARSLAEQRAEALRESERRLATGARAFGTVLFEQDRELRYTWLFNPDPAVGAAVGRTDAEVFGEENARELVELKRRVLASGDPVSADVRLEIGGEARWLLVTLEPMRAAAGEVAGLVGAAMDITARKRAEEALRRANERLETAAREKDSFLAMLSHELRNPLGAISNASRVIRLRVAAGQEIARPLATLERQVRNAARLLDDLLDVSRITRGLVELRTEPVELESIVASAVEAQRPLLDAAGQSLALDLPEAPLAVVGDPTRLEQVAANLLHNAVKYTPEGGHIRVALSREGEDAVLRVEDDGAGIAPDLLPRVFDLFVQGDPGLARSRGGLGIGLTLVKRLVELHGGTVEARSEGPGRGSSFTVRLRALRPPRRTGGRSRRKAGAGEPSRPAPRAAPASGARVLVVEDNLDAAALLAEYLRALGHDVRVANDGAQALGLVGDFTPEVALLDVGLPGMDGYELAQRLRTRLGEATLLVAVTGYGQPSDQRLARAAGFERHLTKPVSPEDLAAIVASVVEARRPAPAV